MAEVPFRPTRQLSEYKGKGASASREVKDVVLNILPYSGDFARMDGPTMLEV